MPGIFQQFNDSIVAAASDSTRNNKMFDLDFGAQYELTLALIKPNAFDKAAEIEERVKEEGFIIIQRKETTLTEDEAREFYVDHTGKDFYETLVEFMTSGSIVALALSRENAIKCWRNLLGPGDVEKAKQEVPDSIRALYGDTAGRNGAHGSDSPENAARELQFFFPDMTVDCFLMSGVEPLEESDIDESVSPVLLEGLRAIFESQPDNPVEWLADWLRKNNVSSAAMAKESNDGGADELQDDDTAADADRGAPPSAEDL